MLVSYNTLILSMEHLTSEQQTKLNEEPLKAVKTNDAQTVVLLLDQGANINHIDLFGVGALRYADGRGYTKMVRLLIERGADVNHIDIFGSTPLMAAAGVGHAEVAKVLIERGANVNHADHRGNTALQSPAGHGYTEAVRLLIDHGARIPTEEYLQRVAQQYPDTPALLENARQAPVNTFAGNGLTYAAARGDAATVHTLLSTLPKPVIMANAATQGQAQP